ncbi:hypothetical protein LZ198_12115 [Myxococcus sp. K15C18031901]|uniref:hypothetical protein n=1 Tax=Myxococcus dinghuensis TaxID=2906761 RepID=UPI0020A8106D|nr:hypothetical protein [Myxococcus dinghuensis]MCP3099613.1 hypothetical protein [Myxococcus dinghuensis]
MTRNWIWACAVLLSGLLSYGVYWLISAGDMKAMEVGARDATEVQRLTAQVRALEASVARSEQLAREAQVAARAAGTRVDTPTGPTEDATAIGPPDSDRSTVGTAVAHPEPTPDEVVARMDARFFSEDVDPTWSRDATQRAEKLGALMPRGARVVSLECRSSMCRLQMSHPSQDDFQRFLREGLIDDSNAWDGPFMAAITSALGRPGEVEAVAYLARAGVDLAP